MFNFILAVWGCLTIILTGIGLFSTIHSFWGFEVISYPDIVLESYRIYRNEVFRYVIEWWFPFSVPERIKDIVFLYFFCSITVYNYYKWLGALDQYGKLRVFFSGPLLLVMGINMAFDKNIRKEFPEHTLFWIGHVIAAALFSIVAIIFLGWNYFLIKNL